MENICFLLNNISYAYEDKIALKNIDLTIKEGESVALLGTNGCGKSSLLKLMNGLIFPARGTLHFYGKEISKKTLSDNIVSKAFHQRVGFVFQNPDNQLFCSSVYEEIAFGPRQMGLEENEINKRVEDCLDLFGLNHCRDSAPYHLSGGEKRKVSIACVMSMNPQVLVMDEPLNGLDPKTQRWLVECMKQLHLAGKTLVTATHDLSCVKEMAQRGILFRQDHTIVADAPIEEILLQKELLREINLI